MTSLQASTRSITIVFRSSILEDILGGISTTLHEILLGDVTDEYFAVLYGVLADHFVESTDIFLDAFAAGMLSRIQNVFIPDHTPAISAIFDFFKGALRENALSVSVGDEELVGILYRNFGPMIQAAEDNALSTLSVSLPNLQNIARLTLSAEGINDTIYMFVETH